METARLPPQRAAMQQHDSFQVAFGGVIAAAGRNGRVAIELSFRFACSFFNHACIFGSTRLAWRRVARFEPMANILLENGS